jgi:hypothetical protein
MRLAMILALVAALAGAWGAFQRAGRVEARADLEAAQRQLTEAQAVIDNQREVARVHRAHLARLQEREAATVQLLREIEQMEGGDALLSDYLDGAGRLLWP